MIANSLNKLTADSTQIPKGCFKLFRPSLQNKNETLPKRVLVCSSKLELIEINFYANLNRDRTQLKRHFHSSTLPAAVSSIAP